MNKWGSLRQSCPKLYKFDIPFECAEGWYDIIHELSLKIEAILEEDLKKFQAYEGEENEYIEMYAIQIKEKYGTLRFYMSHDTEEISKLLSKAEYLSSKTCENCGEPATMRGNQWITTRCDKCYKEKI